MILNIIKDYSNKKIFLINLKICLYILYDFIKLVKDYFKTTLFINFQNIILNFNLNISLRKT